MSAPSSTPASDRDADSDHGTVVWAVASALGVALAGLVLLVALSLVGWSIDRPAGAEVASAARVGTQAWYLAHGIELPVSWGALSLPPLLVTAMIAVFFYRSGRTAVRACRLRRPAEIAESAAAMAITYTTVAILLSSVAYPGPDLLSIGEIALGAGPVSFLAPVAGMLRESGYGARLVATLPGPSYAYSRGALASLWTLGAASAAVVAGGLLLGFNEASALTASLAPAGLGGFTIIGISIGYLPNAMLLATALGSGAGFTLGGDSTYSLTTVRRETLPTFPLFAALPQAAGLLTWLVALVPVAAAVVGALTLTRHLEREHRTPANLLTGALMGSLLTALAVLGAAVAAMGGLGSGRLADVGAEPLRVAGFLLVVLAVVSTVTAFIATARSLTPAAAARRKRALSVIETTSDLTADDGDEVAELQPDRSARPVIASKLAMRRLARSGKVTAAQVRTSAAAAEAPDLPKRSPDASLSVVRRAREIKAAKAVAADTSRVLTGERKPFGKGATAVRRGG